MNNQMALIKRVHELEEGSMHLRLNLKESDKVCRLRERKIETLKAENEDLKTEVAKFRGKNSYKTSRIKRLIKKGLVRMVQIEKLESENAKLRGE